MTDQTQPYGFLREAGLDVKTATAATPPAPEPPESEAPPPDTAELDLKDPEGKTSRNRPGGMNVGRLKGFVERLEKLDEERRAIGGDIKDVYSEAKGVGYDTKTIRKIIALRRMDAADRAEQETLLDVYKHALGMV